ncbi:MAG: caspase family protein [Anaerolineales bacterium]
MSSKYALVIGNTEYADPGLAQLTAPGKDAEDFARVLKEKDLCEFDEVRVLLNQVSSSIIEAIDEFFDQKKPDDLLVLYFSGHGVRDELGALYLAVKNTFRSRLRSTAIKSDYIREVMDQSRSRRQVLVLDCCNSGAFQQGTKAATGMSVGTATAFEGGYGRIILTASDSTQFAWEGDKVIGETDNSLFTHFLVEGLEGEADMDGDGRITVDELYDYAYEKVKHATPKQTPSKFSSKQQGEIILRQNMSIEEIRSVPLPTPLLDSIDNPFSDIRLGAVQQLTKLLNGKNLGLARSAREALEKIAQDDDSRQVQRAAAQALESVREAEGKAQEAESDIITKEAQSVINERVMVAERLEKEKVKRTAARAIQEEISKPEAETRIAPLSNQQAILWMTVGWVVAGAIGGAIFWAGGDFSEQRGGAVGWGMGGLVTAMILRTQGILASRKNIFAITLVWIFSGIVAVTIATALTEAVGTAIGDTIGILIALASTLGIEELRSRWKDIRWLILFWAISSAVGWTIGKGVQGGEGFLFGSYIGKTAGWGLGWAVSGAIGGYVLGRQLLQATKEPARKEFVRKEGIAGFIEKHKNFFFHGRDEA